MYTDLSFFPGKLLRLSFHDCLKYKDGSGGCDGCLNWHGVGQRFGPGPLDHFSYKYPDIKETNNNGLEYTVELLETLYTSKSFPWGSPSLKETLKAS